MKNKVDGQELLKTILEKGEKSPSYPELAEKYHCTEAALWHWFKKFKSMGISIPEKYHVDKKQDAWKNRSVSQETKKVNFIPYDRNSIHPSIAQDEVHIANMYLATALSILGYTVQKIKKEENRVLFHFLDSPALQRTIKQFYNHELHLDVLSFVQQLHSLQEQIALIK